MPWRNILSAEVSAGLLLIAVPIAFNVAFFELGRAFDYPNILRKEPDEDRLTDPRSDSVAAAGVSEWLHQRDASQLHHVTVDGLAEWIAWWDAQAASA